MMFLVHCQILLNKFLIRTSVLCTKFSFALQYLASHQVSNNWIASVSFIVTRKVVGENHLINNVQNLFSAALIKGLVGSTFVLALLPK